MLSGPIKDSLLWQARQSALRALVSDSLNTGDALPTILQRCAEALVRELAAAFARIWTVKPDTNSLELQASAGLYTHLDGRHSRVTIGDFKIGRIAQTRRPHITNDVNNDPEIDDTAWTRREGLVAFAGYPLLVEDRVVGVMALFARRQLGEEVIDTLAAIADTIAQGIERKRAEEALRETEAQYRSIFEATTEGLLIRNLDGIIVEVNPAHCRMSGYSRDELIGQPVTKVIHPDYHHITTDTARAIQAGQSYHVEALSLRKDGTTYPVEAHGTAFTYKGKPHVLAVVRDITDRVEAYRLLEQRVAERTQELSTLLDISRTVASTLELRPLLTLILEQLRLIAHYDRASIFMLEGDALAVLAFLPTSLPRTPNGLGVRYSLDDIAPIWSIISSGNSLILPDLWADGPLEAAFQQVAEKYHAGSRDFTRCWLGAPLTLKDHVIGMLVLSSATPFQYTQRHADMAKAVAHHAALAIENARLYAEVQDKAALEERQRLARELHDSVSQALYGIVLGAETARAYLDTHPDRLARPLEYIRSLADAGLAEMKALIFELRPESLATEGIVVALTKHTAALRARHEIAVETQLCDEPQVALEVKEALYRIAQEALHNIVKHAEASRVYVQLACDATQVRLDVRDNGLGFEPNGDFPGHLGLKSMRERATRLGGRLEIESAPGQGTTIHATIPAQAT